MTTYRYTLTADSPISAGVADARGNTRHAHSVIPGATVRGALAALWWRDHSEHSSTDQKAFAELFDRRLVVSQAVPEEFELIPASARLCKYRHETGIADCVTMVLETGFPGQTSAWTSCPHCGGPLDAQPGWRARSASAAAMGARTRGQLDERETAEDGKLFTRHALLASSTDKCVVLSGLIDLPEATADELNWLNDARVRVGGARSLNYGNCQVTLENINQAEQGAADLGPTLALVVSSPVILLDAWGGPDLSLMGLERELQRVSEEPVKVADNSAWLRTVSVSGWHMRSRLPKPIDWALAPGSVAQVTGLTTAGLTRLHRGIGYRTLEGFGQLTVMTRQRLDAEPENLGRSTAAALRKQFGADRKKWTALRNQVVRMLKEILADPTQAAIIAQTRINGYDTAQHIPIQKVLQLSLGQIPAAITELESR